MASESNIRLQYGFRKQHSTEWTAMELVDRVTQKMDTDEIPFGIFLTFRKLLRN